MTFLSSDHLQSIGLSGTEARIYLGILSLGQANILEISKRTKIPRATIYLHLDKLIADGLINSIVRGKRHIYYAEDPSRLKVKAQEISDSIEELIPGLRTKYLQSGNKPRIKSYEGRHGIVEVFNDILTTMKRGSQYDVILNSKNELAVLGEEFDKYITRRLKKQISLRVITERSEVTRGWLQTQDRYLRQIKYFPRGQSPGISYHIYANKVAIFSFQGPVTGVLIEDKKIADFEKMQFECMWQTLK